MTAWIVKCNDWLGKRMFLGVLTALVAGLLIKSSLIPNPKLAAILLFSYMTLVTALGTSLKQFVGVLKRPWVPVWILLIVHIITPALAWIIGILFFPHDEMIRLGYLVGSAIPIGATAVLWSAIAGGSVPISLVAVTLDTLIAPLILPVFFHVVAGQSIAIAYWDMTKQLLYMITLPSIAGMLLNDWLKGKAAEFARGIGGVTSKLCFYAVIVINVAVVAPDIHFNVTIIKIAFVTFLIVALNYALGYLGAKVFQFSDELTVSMIYNVGLRNISTGLVLALSYFPPAVAIPITLGMLYQQPLAALIPRLLNQPKSRESQD